MNDQVAEVVRARRRELGITQSDLAAEAGVSRVSVTRIEHGSGVHTDTLTAVASALGIRIIAVR